MLTTKSRRNHGVHHGTLSPLERDRPTCQQHRKAPEVGYCSLLLTAPPNLARWQAPAASFLSIFVFTSALFSSFDSREQQKLLRSTQKVHVYLIKCRRQLSRTKIIWLRGGTPLSSVKVRLVRITKSRYSVRPLPTSLSPKMK